MNEKMDLSDFSMLDLFSLEVETQGEVLNDHLLTLENQLQDSPDAQGSLSLLEALMRASHSIKRAARIVQIEPAVKIGCEDCPRNGRLLHGGYGANYHYHPESYRFSLARG